MLNLFDSQKKRLPKPSWLRCRLPNGQKGKKVEEELRSNNLHSVCVEARCPNRGECWNRGTATFLILGNICTRNCRFCAVKSGTPLKPDESEPDRLASAVNSLQLRHVVVTSVTRDDLDDGGAHNYVQTIKALRKITSQCIVEVLVPDFRENKESLSQLLDAAPNILAHNMETVPRLYKKIRPQANYKRSLQLLGEGKRSDAGIFVKSGVMVGLGETLDELVETIEDIHKTGCDILTIGQYLQPSKSHCRVRHYWKPEEFEELKRRAYGMGFLRVESGPLVRSSYRAADVFESCLKT